MPAKSFSAMSTAGSKGCRLVSTDSRRSARTRWRNGGRRKMAFQVLTGEIAHETNTFSIVPTTLESFRRRTYLTDNEIPATRRGTHTEFGATFETADKYGWTL